MAESTGALNEVVHGQERPEMPGARPALRLVVVATDFSPGAAPALARAATLPIAPGGSVAILHVLPESPEPPPGAKAEAEVRRALDVAGAEAARAREAAGQPRIDVKIAVRTGRPFLEIIRFARESRAELIVIGRHRKRPLRDLFLGSTAERVIRKGDRPVLLVNREPKGPYRRPLVACDLSETSRRATELAIRLVNPAVRAMDVVHAFEPPFENVLRRSDTPMREIVKRREEHRREARAALERFFAALGEKGLHWKLHLRHGDPRRVIRRQVGRRHPDLVVLGTHGRSGLAQILIGSVAETVVREVPCDVLVARPDERVFELP